MSGFIYLEFPVRKARIIQGQELLKQVYRGQLEIISCFIEMPQKHLSSSMSKVN